MSWIDAITSFLNPVFHPLVNIHPFFAIVIVSFAIALFNSWVYKLMTDQHQMKALKDEMKKMQDEVRKYKDNASKMMEIQGKLMKRNLDYMKHSFKPTFVTMIPILIILGWMTSHLAYDPVMPGVPVNVTVFFDKTVTGSASLQVPSGLKIIGPAMQSIDTKTHTIVWTVEGITEGKYQLEFTKDGEVVKQPITISTDADYAKPVVRFSDSETFIQSKIHNKSKVVLDLGFYKMGYLLTYILCAILFSLGIRKLMKLH